MPRLPRVLVLYVAMLFVLAACRERSDPAEDLEETLYAPCCWRQTLRDHDSPVAAQLRTEIESRLGAGEPQQQIERDLVSRYGEKLRALPRDGDPRWMIGGAAAAAAVGGLVLLMRLVRRRGDRSARAGAPEEVNSEDSDRLDDELALVE